MARVLAACLLVFRAQKAAERRKQTLFVDVSRLFKRGRNQNTLEPEHVAQIHHWYEAYSDIPGVARVVALEEIARNDWNLNIPCYVEPLAQEETLTVEEALANLNDALTDAYAAEDRLRALLQESGLMGREKP